MEMNVLSQWMWMLGALVILAALSFTFLQQSRVRNLPKLPKGRWSLPFIGETRQLLRQGFPDFLLEHLARYGDPFTISIFGKNILVVNSPEAIKFVLSTAHTSFPAGYGKNMNTLTGEGKFRGPGHPYFRRIVLVATTGEKLHDILPFINSLAKKTVNSWEMKGTVNTCDELWKFTFRVAMHVIWADVEMDSQEMEQIMQDMAIIEKGMIVIPIKFPGFFWPKALKTRQGLVARLKETIAKRRREGSKVRDVLNTLMEMDEFECSDYDICCIMLSLMFAGYSTTATLIPWVIKYLQDYPEVRQRVQDEQDGIRQRLIEDKSLKWFKVKNSTPLTSQVIDETLRLTAVVPAIPRLAETNVEYNGFVFPKDLLVLASTTSVHHDPKLFPDPLMFDPSRFEVSPKPNKFMPFGNGPHMCPGSELAKVETLFIVHHLVSNYSWKEAEPIKGFVNRPTFARRTPVGGFPIKIKRRTS